MLDAAEHKRKTAHNRASSLKRLEAVGVEFTCHNNGAHLVVRSEKGLIDFWPGTGKWIGRTCDGEGRGVLRLLRFIHK